MKERERGKKGDGEGREMSAEPFASPALLERSKSRYDVPDLSTDPHSLPPARQMRTHGDISISYYHHTVALTRVARARSEKQTGREFKRWHWA